MTRLESLIELTLTLKDTFTSPEAHDIYAGIVTIAGLVIVAELVLGMF